MPALLPNDPFARATLPVFGVRKCCFSVYLCISATTSAEVSDGLNLSVDGPEGERRDMKPWTTALGSLGSVEAIETFAEAEAEEMEDLEGEVKKSEVWTL